MTHDCCLMPDWQGCVVLADSTHDTPQSFTCHWPSILAIVLSWNPPTQLPYHMSMSHIVNRLHDDRQYGDCEMSGWYQQTVDVHCGLHRCCYLVLTMCWRQWHLCRSSPPITSQTCEEHITNRVVRVQADRAHWTLRHVLGWAGGSGVAVYISQYALFPSSPIGIRYNTAFWITYDNFIACKRRVNRVIRIFIGSATTYMNNNKTLFFPWGLHVYCLHCTFENGANQTTIICTLTIFLWKIIYFVRLYFIQLFVAIIVHWMCIHH